ncbi:MAG: hypothetical protein J6W10_02015 [Kiritimatiellae bacterium]|nr:hypothetical protein [Kiritimatiellia bacterium]
MKFIKAYVKKPEKEPEEKIFRPNLQNISKLIGGPMYTLKIQLTTGKKIVVIYNQFQPTGIYNFTICPTEDKKSFVDITGTVIVCGRTEDDRLIGLDLDPEEQKEIFRQPYEV